LRVASSPALLPDGSRQEHANLTSVGVGIELCNAGRVPITYSMKSLRVTYSGRLTDAGAYLSRGGLVLPGSSMHFWSTPVALDPPVTTFPGIGRITCVFEYWRSDDTARRELKAEIEYTLAGAAPGSATNWIFVDEPPAA
jgi:hypothetical protein